MGVLKRPSAAFPGVFNRLDQETKDFYFGKRAEHNLQLLRGLRALVETGYPVLVGTSRKGFLGALSGGADVDDRLEASLATATWAMAQGVAAVRVHDVAATVQAARLVAEPVQR